MKNKKPDYIFLSFWCLAILSFIWNVSKINAQQKNMERVTAIEYTYTCTLCNSDIAEGYYSFVDRYGYRECKNCNNYTVSQLYTITGDDNYDK